MSGSRVTMRSQIAPQARPSFPAPRRILSTLYCAGESASRARASPRPTRNRVAVRCRPTKTSSSRVGKGFVCWISRRRRPGTWRP
jgi:hypothetical protein